MKKSLLVGVGALVSIGSTALVTTAAGCSSSNSPNGATNTMNDGATAGDTGEEAAVAADAGGDGALLHIDRSGLADAGTSGSLDYSNPSLWVCRPGTDQNPCLGNLDATELEPDGGRQVVSDQPAASPKFDCFYVYPTVDLTTNGNMTNFSDISLVLDPIIAQAERFSDMCTIYAPLYRQVAFSAAALPTSAPDAGGDAGSGSGLSNLMSSPAAALALQDVHDAFHYYLDHFNNGRKFVIMGHSQGSATLAKLMQTDVDPVPAVRSQMISALLIGGGTTVAPGQNVNGTFKNIPTCAKPGDIGCMVAFSSYDVATPPGANALFGASPDGNQVACTNPSTLAGMSGPYQGSYFPEKINNPLLQPDNQPPDASTPFVLYRNVFQGGCVMKNGRSYLEVTYLGDAGDPRGVPPYTSAGATSTGFGLHLVDYDIPMQELLETVKLQAAAAGL
ncbi:MAG TPA: DUF3089 domain-containing protein [Polyangiaceae bacterium]|nr:DUF3089 domain-containing protein [Polyangiaceae bacterium]